MVSVRLWVTLLVCLCLGCALGGCGGGGSSANPDNNTPANDPNSLVGTWTARSLTDGTTTQTCPAAFATAPTSIGQYGNQCASSDTLTFYRDGYYRVNGGSLTYRYAFTPGTNQVSLIIQNDPNAPPPHNSGIGGYAHGVVDLTNNTLTLHPDFAANVNTFAVQALPSSGTVQEVYQRAAGVK